MGIPQRSTRETAHEMPLTSGISRPSSLPISASTAAGKDIKNVVKETGFKPDLRKRGSMRTVFDGRHKFTRYFSPLQRNRPTTLDTLYQYNDPELFDLEKDPSEMRNLAATKGANEATVLAMNAKLNALIAAEVGEDVGQMLPAGVDGGWVATNAARDV